MLFHSDEGWLLGHTYKSMSHCSSLSSERILGPFSASLECSGMWWHESPLQLTQQAGHKFGSQFSYYLSKCSELSKIKFQMHSELHRQRFSCFFKTSSLTQSTYSSILLINGHCKCSASSTKVTFLNFRNHSNPAFFKLPVLQKLPPTFWKFLYYFYQFRPKFNADMLSRYNETANGKTHKCMKQTLLMITRATASFQAGIDAAASAPSTLNGNSVW